MASSSPTRLLSEAQLVTLRLECLKLAVATLPVQFLALPNSLQSLEQRANDLLRYMQTGMLSQPLPRPKKFHAEPIVDDLEKMG